MIHSVYHSDRCQKSPRQYAVGKGFSTRYFGFFGLGNGLLSLAIEREGTKVTSFGFEVGWRGAEPWLEFGTVPPCFWDSVT